jgi:hypothetical protein
MTPAPPPPSDQELQLHIAEYNALTTRSSYYIVIAASLYPILILVISGILALWNSVTHVLIVWSAVFAVQAFSFAMIDNARWQYENIYYIEKILRPLVDALVGKIAFWTYEQILSQQRGKTPQWWECTPAMWGGVAIVAASFERLYELNWPHLGALRGQEWVGFVVDLGFLGIVIWKSIRLIALRQSIF